MDFVLAHHQCLSMILTVWDKNIGICWLAYSLAGRVHMANAWIKDCKYNIQNWPQQRCFLPQITKQCLELTALTIVCAVSFPM